ncbi:hypothetical protein Cni_G23736 [Canna indica]|uniref:WIYLD domain-containing protein n=1 Tax=Canna indica TaxID=4628 RepID=A0AAQ3QNW0_9LILI|nr:hypothetical protein Cni_G23736 [Canna indica]
MAPKKQKKVRMVAAIDALVNYGFTEKIIVATIKKLLNVYGDDNVWTLIEEDNYKLVIEAILDNQEEEVREEEKTREGTSGAEKQVAETSKRDLEETRASDVPTQIAETSTRNLEETRAIQVFSGVTETGKSVDWKDDPCTSKDCASDQIMNQDQSTSTAREYGPLSNSSSGRQQNLPRRLPCYGWISESESEDEKTPVQRAIVVKPVQRIRKRPSGWDVKPSHV